ncbi:flagellar basal body rod protein FlgB [Mangrovitalea sediminis]|uniref:flagellar basal body rod protein FlgB n=1 Tax=Mangrovitalea sediminis TaxID=1982043 RepID=UPI000BE5BF58|nr:flagellar basal body rod protein FlgB [Mangrovitalea sediminis]
MAISFDKALGIHEKALELRVQRAQVLANNLANADTPDFKARDFDFRAALDQAQSNTLPLEMTNSRDIPGTGSGGNPPLLYRIPSQPSIDGNTVDTQTELSEYTKNAMDFQASFQFLNSRVKGLMSAIRGE